MKTSLFYTLILLFILFSCTKDDGSDISGEWHIIFSVPLDAESNNVVVGTLTLADNNDEITGSIVIDDDGYFLYAELLPGTTKGRTYKIVFESYSWITNDQISTFTFTYSGLINATCDFMEGVFTSGDFKIGDWLAVKK
jgi:hypothetical protein